jgi:hypothetical protein
MQDLAFFVKKKKSTTSNYWTHVVENNYIEIVPLSCVNFKEIIFCKNKLPNLAKM